MVVRCLRVSIVVFVGIVWSESRLLVKLCGAGRRGCMIERLRFEHARTPWSVIPWDDSGNLSWENPVDANPAFPDPQLHRALVEQMPDALIHADREGTILLWNRGAEKVFGFAADEVLGRSLDVIIPPHLRQGHREGMRRAIEAGHTRGGSRVRTTRSLHKDGRRLYVELSFGLVVDAAGAVVGTVAVGRDGTERYLREQAMRQRSKPAP